MSGDNSDEAPAFKSKYVTIVMVTLVSSDGHEFEVDSEVLKTQSAFFRESLANFNLRPANWSIQPDIAGIFRLTARPSQQQTPSANSNKRKHSNDIIHLDVPSSDLELFLDLLHEAHQTRPPMFTTQVILPLSQAKRLFAIVDKFDCAELPRRLMRDQLDLIAKEQPWGMLQMAADQDDYDLAKCALSKFTMYNIQGDTFKGYDWKPSRVMDQLGALPVAWRLEVMRLGFLRDHRGDWMTTGRMMADSLNSGAAVFDPARHTCTQ